MASFNTGSDIPTDGIVRSPERVVPVKPILNLYHARSRILSGGEGLNLVVIGGGPAGVEISGNLRRLVGNGKGRIWLIAGDRLLAEAPARARNLAGQSLRNRGVNIMEGVRANAVGEKVVLSNGDSLPYDLAFMAVGVRSSAIFQNSGIPTGSGGGMLVDRYLRSIAHPEIFGGGDCIDFAEQQLARVVVYAVRQNPILYHNLLATLEGDELKPFNPGGEYMLALNLGDGSGILWKYGLAINGRPAFLLKDFIDRRFMREFQVSDELLDPVGSLELC